MDFLENLLLYRALARRVFGIRSQPSYLRLSESQDLSIAQVKSRCARFQTIFSCDKVSMIFDFYGFDYADHPFNGAEPKLRGVKINK